MTKKSVEELEVIASEFRHRFGIAQLRCPDVETLLERVAASLNIRLERRFDDEMPDEQASADAEARIIYYRDSLRCRLKAGDKVARFIFLEEIGHIVLGHSGIRHRSLKPKIHEKSVAQVRIEESEARYFAAAVLAPLSLIQESWDAIFISEHFQISLTAAEIRKEEAEKAKRLRTGKVRDLPGFVVDFLKEARARGYNVQSKID